MSTEYLIPEIFLEKIESFLSSDRKTFSFNKFKKYATPQLKEWLEERDIPPKFLFYVYKNHLTKITKPTCPNCRKELSFLQILNGGIFCSKRCLNSSQYHKDKTKQTFFQKYGVEHPSQLKEIKKKKEETTLKNYGVKNPFQSDVIKAKIKQTNLEKYGFEHPAQSKEIQEKAKQTNLEKYGVENPIQSKEVQEKTKQTNLEKYGFEHPAQSKEVQEKTKQTNLEKYGVENPLQNQEVQEKIQQTNLEKYGVENPIQSKEVQEKIQQTCLERYGVTCSLHSKEIEERVKQTNLKKYGFEHPAQSKEVQEKIKHTNLEKYGFEHPAQSKEIQEKAKQTNLEKYGVKNPFQSKEIQEKSYKTHKEKYYETFCGLLNDKNIKLLSDKDDFITNNVHKFKCLRCGTEFEFEGSNSQRIWCPSCAEKQGTSTKELDVINYIKSLCDETTEIITNDRKVLDGKELDVYIPSKSLAFEFDGNFWHSELRKEKQSHQEKTLLCREKGIRLIHIFEYEWGNNRQKIEGLIKSALGVFEKTIYARECECREVSSFEYNAFLDLNHLQGKVNSSIRYGLYYDGELVSVIGFGKSRFKGGEFELYRFCNKLGYRIIGGFSKLIKHSNVKEFVSYVDLAHFSGKGYKSVGFKEIGITKPNYIYVKGNRAITRITAQKHKLKELLQEGYDENLSESDNMAKNNWLKVYDCGNLKMKYSA